MASLAARKRKNALFTFCCFAATAVATLILVVLLGSLIKQGLPRLNLDLLSNFHSRFPAKAGIKAALYGSIWVIALTALISVPVGIAAAVYLEAFVRTRNRWTEFIQLNISNLAGVPSIVYGLLGLAVFARPLFTGAPDLGRSILTGALTMSLLILPMLITVAQEAIRAVPSSYREGALALGATDWQAIRRQVLPAAAPGILTGIILSLSRAMGETAPLIIVGAVAYVARVPQGVSDTYTVLPIQIFNWTSEAKTGYHDAAASAILVLMAALLSFNSIAIFLRNRASR